MSMLEFHRDIVEELTEELLEEEEEALTASAAPGVAKRSSLVVLGEGLGLSTVVSALLSKQVSLLHSCGNESEGERERNRDLNPNRLVILIGFTEYQRKCILAAVGRQQLRSAEAASVASAEKQTRKATTRETGEEKPAIGEIDSSVGANERSRLYAIGGCLFVTTRILTVSFFAAWEATQERVATSNFQQSELNKRFPLLLWDFQTNRIES